MSSEQCRYCYEKAADHCDECGVPLCNEHGEVDADGGVLCPPCVKAAQADHDSMVHEARHIERGPWTKGP